jgi:hypothetical protein
MAGLDAPPAENSGKRGRHVGHPPVMYSRLGGRNCRSGRAFCTRTGHSQRAGFGSSGHGETENRVIRHRRRGAAGIIMVVGEVGYESCACALNSVPTTTS